MRTALLQLCLCVTRRFALQFTPNENTNNYYILRNFEKLIEQNYLRFNLPKRLC